MTTRNWKFLAGGLVIAAAIGILVGVSFQENMAYYIEVADYLSKGPAAEGSAYRIRGHVIPGTIQKTSGKLGVLFAMGDGGKQMTVRYAREVPDTFKEHAEVVVEGAMGQDGVFEAHTLLAKCPSKYEAAEARGETPPHS